MKSIINFFDKLQNRPSYKYFLNVFLLKEIQSFSLKQLNYIQVFLKIKNFLKIKIFKFNYNFYNFFIIIFICINLSLQILLFFI